QAVTDNNKKQLINSVLAFDMLKLLSHTCLTFNMIHLFGIIHNKISLFAIFEGMNKEMKSRGLVRFFFSILAVGALITSIVGFALKW
ncbi:hypothetical protein ACLI2G_16735, partial [Enterococcus faecalis]